MQIDLMSADSELILMDECVFECLWGQWGPSGYIMRKSRNCQLTWVPIRKVSEHDIQIWMPHDSFMQVREGQSEMDRDG